MGDTKKDGGSETPVLESTETDGVQAKAGQPPVTEDQWKAMKSIIETVVSYRDADNHDPSRIFHKKVSKRLIPEYYEVIKEPMAINSLRASSSSKSYKTFSDFVRDCALIWHNAHTYNRPDAGAYIDASAIKGLMETEFEKLIEQKIITSEEAVWPDLGEIPPVDDIPPEEEEDDEDEDEDEDDDEEGDESDDEKKKRKRGRRSSATASKKDGAVKDETQRAGDLATKKKRGRPPKVDTPMETRIKNVLKGIRKPKNDQGQIMVLHFEKLPDKAVMPEYYAEIKEPIAIELIKRKQKRKKYHSVDHFMRDIDTMFNNAKAYNLDESQIYKDAISLQKEAHKLAEIEKQKPDSDFVMEEGRIPLPNGIVHNNELWQVGDWIHIQNTNDITKPIVAQIYRTWQDTEGQKWVNACWYYRPEQTVHQYEKHFFPNEVVKTGQYRDHHVEEIIDRCFVMFFTRYYKGRPRGIPADREVYVCEARYNEEKHKLNKIKTWASCLPDEVRDKDYEMDLWETHKKVKKVPSPLLHMLKDDANETDEPPQPRWGADNAPPTVGGIYKGPRDENQSPPPEPTPSPPPQPPPPLPRQTSSMSNFDTPTYRRSGEAGAAMDEENRGFGSAAQPSPSRQVTQAFVPPSQKYQQHAAAAAAAAPIQYHQHSQHALPQTPQPQYNGFNPAHGGSQTDYLSTPSRYVTQPGPSRLGPLPGTVGHTQRAVEVFHLTDNANLAIPEDVRKQYQRDEHGRVLFFTTPPLDVLPPVKKGAAMAHTTRYLAEKLRKAGALKEATAQKEMARRREEAESRKRKHEEETVQAKTVQELMDESLMVLIEQMEHATDMAWKSIYGDKWEEGKKFEMERLAARQAEHLEKVRLLSENARKRQEAERLERANCLKGPPGGVYLDDIDPRY